MGARIAALEKHADRVVFAAFSPDGGRIVTASFDKTARIWDAKTGQQLAKFEGHRGEVLCAAFSPDGGQIVTASQDGTARLWQVANPTSFSVIQGDGGRMSSAAHRPWANWAILLWMKMLYGPSTRRRRK